MPLFLKLVTQVLSSVFQEIRLVTNQIVKIPTDLGQSQIRVGHRGQVQSMIQLRMHTMEL